MKMHYENGVTEKENLLISQRKIIESCEMCNLIKDKEEKIHLLNDALVASSRDSYKTMVASSTAEYDELKKEHDTLINLHSEEQKRLVGQYEHVIDSKDKEFSNLNEVIIGLNATPIITLKLARTEGEMFRTRTRSKGSGKNINIQSVNIQNVTQLMLTPLDATCVQNGFAKAAKMLQLQSSNRFSISEKQYIFYAKAVINYNGNTHVKLLHRSICAKPRGKTIVQIKLRKFLREL